MKTKTRDESREKAISDLKIRHVPQSGDAQIKFASASLSNKKHFSQT
jgi:hypothetical protein